MYRNLLRLGFTAAALFTWLAAGCGPPDNADSPSSRRRAIRAVRPVCDRASFAAISPTATSVLVTGSFTQPKPWAADLAAGALALDNIGGAFTLRAKIPPASPIAPYHDYKYIVDGAGLWQSDPYNPLHEPDGLGGDNSEIADAQTFIYYDFFATSVWLTGSFTLPKPWAATIADGAVPLGWTDGGWWATGIVLPTGRNLYKFIVDSGPGWWPDPLNPDLEPDGTGLGYNSVITVCNAY